MLDLASDFAFNILVVTRITLGVFENNVAAFHCYKKAGFFEFSSENVVPEIYEYMDTQGNIEKWKIIEMEKKNYLFTFKYNK